MAQTIIEKILSTHAGRAVAPGDIVDVEIDARIARDFGGANVVKHLTSRHLGIADPRRTFFTFDCNPGGSDQKYAANQHACRQFAREHGIRIYDVDSGIGTHVAIDAGLIGPGGTLISTDSHANILGAIGAFGQGMGDQDVAHAFAYGKVWFKVPPTVRIELTGLPAATATPKDITLKLISHFGANGLLGYAAEVYGDYIDRLGLSGRITLASMCTEAGGIILLFPPNDAVLEHCTRALGQPARPVHADPDAHYDKIETINIAGLGPQIARPGHPDDAVAVRDVAGLKIDSVFIGSCTNGRYEDLRAAAEVLRGRHVAPGVVLKIVPSTDGVWRRLLHDGLLTVFKDAGALISNAGCGGCAAGQVGQNGPGEVTVSTGNRNFPGKQGGGMVLLASPETAAASAIAGTVTSVDAIPATPATFDDQLVAHVKTAPTPAAAQAAAADRPTHVHGRVWIVRQDNIDTDMIYHNRHLAVTNPAEMGQYAFGNLAGWEDFARRCQPGDIIVTGQNFGCGSSRQQAVDCFLTLGVVALIAESFGAIYERNAINAGLPILSAPLVQTDIENGEEIDVDFTTGEIRRADGEVISATPMADAQLSIYQRGGLLVGA